jgi:hypothetical protein
MRSSVTRSFFLILLALMLNITVHGQLPGRSYFAAPGVHAGYTFGAGLTYGLTLDLGVQKATAQSSQRCGISLSWSAIHTKKYIHRMRTFSLMAANDFLQLKTGWGRVRNPWGYGNRNRCVTHGIFLDAALAYPDANSPWIGIRTFQYPLSSWAWFTKPYNTVYAGYQYNVTRNNRINNYLSL